MIKNQEALRYLKDYVLKKEVFLRFDGDAVLDDNAAEAYVYLKNKIFVNAYLIKSGMARADRTKEYKYRTKFIEFEREAK